MKIDRDEAYVCWSRLITPLNEVDCTRDVETRPPKRSLIQCRVTACAANMYSVQQRAFTVREYWRMGSFKQCQRAFRNKYGEGSVPTWSCIHKLVKKIRNNRKCFDSTRRGPEDVWSHGAGYKYMSIFIGNHTKIKKLLRNVWVS
jgi:hypothetical protein